MKITDIKTLVVNAQMRNWVFVKVETDQPGLHGWGEGTLEWKTRAVVGCVEDFKPMVVGRDPTRIEFLWQIMYRHSFFRLGPIGTTAMSAIEQACWDILGKSLGVPVYKLLGGRVRDKVRMYTHLGGGEMKALYETFEVGPLLERAQAVIEKGYQALKVVVVPFSQPLMGLPAVKHFANLMGKLREAVGDEIDLMVDFHGRTTTGQAIQYIRAIEEFHPFFCEEPVPPEQPDALAEVRKSVRVPIATGERLATRWEFRRVCELQACHVLQPDLNHCGGLLEARRIASLGETYLMGIAPHNPNGPVANVVALHYDLATPNFLIQEDVLGDVPWRFDVVQTKLKSENGYWLPLEEPGLGVDINEAEARKHPFQQEILEQMIFHEDGSVAEW
ncbi:MAG: galactonate dehydratase [Acidobacteria bacterium]|nr:MAG: galactonate dehydratase [Acidobacteriota bacterium]